MTQTKLFPVTVVGSWTRPPWLVQALRKRQAGELSSAEFNRIADEAVLVAVKYQEDAGVDIVTDGEMRRDNFYSFVVEKLSGMKLMKVSELLDYMKDRAGFEEILRALDVPAFAIKSPIAVDKLGERDGLALDELEYLKQHTSRRTKIPLPGPYLLTRSSWFAGLSDKAYPTQEELARDVVKILRKEVLALKDRGVDFIQFDEPSLSQVVYGDEAEQTFMCAALGSRRDPTDEVEEPAEIVERVKRVLQFFDPDKIYLNPDCGFGTFAERCVNTPETAYRKLKAVSEAAEMLRRKFA